MAVGAFVAGSIVGKLLLDKKKWDTSVKKVGKDTTDMEKWADKSGKKFGKMGRAMTVAGGVIVGAAVGMVKAFASFDESMVESTAIMGDVSDTMKNKMAEAAMEMSGKSTFAAKDLARGYFYLASAGLDAEQSIAALPVATRFAQAGAFDLALATDLLTDAQSALGLSSKDAALNQQGMVRVSDVLVKANTLANASVAQFSEALTSKAGPAMRAYGVGLEEGVAVLAAFADQGIKGKLAGEKFSIVLRDLQKAAIDNKGAFREAGIAVFDANGNLNNMGDIVKQVEGRLSDMSAEQKKVALTTLGLQEESQLALLTLVGTSEKIKDYEKNLKSAGGITEEVAEKQLQSLTNQLTLAKNSVMNVAISLGEQLAPTVVSMAKSIANIAKKVRDWMKEHPGLTSAIVKTTVAFGALMLTFGPILIMLPKIVLGFQTLKLAGPGVASGIGKIGKAFTWLAANPIVLLIAALAALVIMYMKVKAAQDRANESAMIADEVNRKYMKKLQGAALQAGMTAKEFDDLARSYDNNAAALGNAIRKGEEGKEIQKSLAKVGAESAEVYNEQKAAMDITIPTMEDFNAGLLAIEGSAIGATSRIDKLLIPGVVRLNAKLGVLKAQLDAGVITWDEWAEQSADAREKIAKLEAGLDDLDMAIEDTDFYIGDLGDSTGVLSGVFNDLGMTVPADIGKIPKAAAKAARKTESIWSHMAGRLVSTFSEAVTESLNIASWFYPKLEEFDETYWETTTENARNAYEEQKALLMESMEDDKEETKAAINRAKDKYEKRKAFIMENFKSEKRRDKALAKLEDKHQARLDRIEADALAAKEVHNNSLVELENQYQADLETIKTDELAAREEHDKEIERQQNSLWGKLKTTFGNTLNDMLNMYIQDFIGGILSGAADAASGILSSIGSALKSTTEEGAEVIGKTLGSAIKDVGAGIASLGMSLISLIPALASAIASAATILAAAAPAILTVGAIALGLFAGFKLISGLLSKGKGGQELRAIKDNTWEMKMDIRNMVNNQDFIKEKTDWSWMELVTANTQLDAIKRTGWTISASIDTIKKTLWRTNKILRRLGTGGGGKKKSAPDPTIGGGGGGGGDTATATGTEGEGGGSTGTGGGGGKSPSDIVDDMITGGAGSDTDPTGKGRIIIRNMNLRNVIRLEGLIITDKQYARNRMIPEIIAALKANLGKAELQQALGLNG